MSLNLKCITFFLLIFVLSSTFFSFSRSENEEDDASNAIIYTKLRFLLGLHSLKSKRNSLHSFSPAPSPSIKNVESPSPSTLHVFHSHKIYAKTPSTHRSHSKQQVHKIENGDQYHRARSRHHIVVMVLVLVSVCIALLVVIYAAVSLVCKRYRRKRIQSTNGGNKVSHDPDPNTEFFYLNSLHPILDVESSLKHSLQTVTELKNLNCVENDIPQMNSCDSDVNSSNKAMEQNSDNASCLDEEEDLRIEYLSSDDESFYSVCDSQLNFCIESGRCSPYNDNVSNFKHRDEELPSSYHNVLFQELASNAKATSLLLHKGNQNVPKPPPPPPPPMYRNITSEVKNTNQNVLFQELASNAKATSLLPHKVNQNVPKPPPPPPPPMYRNITSEVKNTNQKFSNEGNSRNVPLHPLVKFQQTTPVGKDGVPLPKLKPLHWDKVKSVPDRSMVWDKISSSSFQLDEQMIESLFSYKAQNCLKNEEAKLNNSSPAKHVLDNKRLQNLTILMKALNATTQQVREALLHGKGLNIQQLEALVKMVPTKEEEDNFQNYKGDIDELGCAEKIVMEVMSIPFSFSRIEAMLYRETFEDEVVHLQKSFVMLEEACEELRTNSLFLRLLEAVLKTGNRMNVGTIRGGACAFKLDTLLKLADVKGTDGKTSLLHFIVQEIIRSEGLNAMEIIKDSKTDEEKEEKYKAKGLEIVSKLSTELCNVKKSASIDLNVLQCSVSNLKEGMLQLKNLLSIDVNASFASSMRNFLDHAERAIVDLKEDERRVLVRVKEITEYYHGDVSKEETNPLRIFVIVRDFLGMLDRVCKEAKNLKVSKSLCMFS